MTQCNDFICKERKKFEFSDSECTKWTVFKIWLPTWLINVSIKVIEGVRFMMQQMADEAKSSLEVEQPLESVKEALVLTAAGPGDNHRSDQQTAPASPRPSTGKNGPLLGQFRAFAKFGDTKADGKTISLSQSDKW